MIRRLAALLTAGALVVAACGDDAGGARTTGTTAAPTTTESGGTVPTDPTNGTTAPTNPPEMPDPATFSGSRWEVVSFGLDGADDPVLPDAVPTIEFGDPVVPPGGLSAGVAAGGTTGCNRWFATAALALGTGISITDLGMTEMACLDEGVMDQEQGFVTALTRIDGFALSERSLVLEAADGSAVIRLRAPDPAPDLPLGGTWRLVTFIDEDVAMSPVSGTEITMTLDPAAGTVAGHAGCNGFSGAIAVDAGDNERTVAVRVGPLASTLMACETEVMDQEAMFHAILAEATVMTVDVGFLTVATDDGRALVFEPAGD